ncbi:MAG: STAS domain-containing protein [Umezawaea sp.]
MVITPQGDPPGLVLTGNIDAADLETLRSALLDGECGSAGGDVYVDLRQVPFVLLATVRALVRTAGELAEDGRRLVLNLAPHHEWAIGAVGWAHAPGLVMANGEVPR